MQNTAFGSFLSVQTGFLNIPERRLILTTACQTKSHPQVAFVFSAETAISSEPVSYTHLHSFLPSFKGAKPYYQAHERGVKLIGATAHFVTTDLDEGPIIEQDVARVDHAMTPEELTAIGRDVECVVLARAVKWFVEHRILLNGHKTVVFR